MREKDQMLHFRVSKAELDIIRQKMQEVGVRNMGAYLRKMAMDGYCIRLDLGDLKKLVSLMRYASNNLNQYAKKANETGSIYLEDIQDMQKRFLQIPPHGGHPCLWLTLPATGRIRDFHPIERALTGHTQKMRLPFCDGRRIVIQI